MRQSALSAMATSLVFGALVVSGCAPNTADLRRSTVPGATTAAPAPRLALRWQAAVVPYEPFVWNPLEYSQPTVSADGQKVVVGTSTGLVVCLDTMTGERLWKVRTGSRVDARPVFDGDQVLVGNDNGSFFALAADSGQERWRYDTRAEIDGAAAVSEGRVFFMNGADELYALDAITGKYLWSYAHDVPDFFTLGNATEPLIHNDMVLVGFADGFLAAIQIDSGQEIWEADLRAGNDEFTDVDGQPQVVGDWIYAASHAGGLHARDLATGEKRWHLDITGASTVVVVGDVLYTTTAGRYVLAIDRTSGQILWRYRHKQNTPSTPTALAGDYIAYGGSEAGFYLTDRSSGYPLLHFDPDAGFNAPVTFEGAVAYALSNKGTLYSFEVVAR